MDDWPLAVQWAVLLTLGATFFGCSWWLAQRSAPADDGARPTSSARVAVYLRSFGVVEWAVTALFVAFLVPLVVRTLAG
jgi:hypothetical protein